MPVGYLKILFLQTTTTASTKPIPRLVDNSGGPCESGELCPAEWNVYDVAQFLRVNDCGNYCDAFSKQVCMIFIANFGVLFSLVVSDASKNESLMARLGL